MRIERVISVKDEKNDIVLPPLACNWPLHGTYLFSGAFPAGRMDRAISEDNDPRVGGDHGLGRRLVGCLAFWTLVCVGYGPLGCRLFHHRHSMEHLALAQKAVIVLK
jgi:hypothetical protein